MLKTYARFLSTHIASVIAPTYLLAAALTWLQPEQWQAALAVLGIALVESGLAIWGRGLKSED